MAFKIFVSDYTRRTESEQLKKLHEKPELENAHIFRPEDLSAMFRATRRTEKDTYYVASVACLAPTKEKLEEFIDGCRARKACIGSIEEGLEWSPCRSNKSVFDAWRLARIDGAARRGGEITGAARKAEIAERAKGLTKEEWTNSKIKNAQLKKKYGVGIWALRVYASSKGWGWNRQKACILAESARKRKEQKSNAL